MDENCDFPNCGCPESRLCMGQDKDKDKLKWKSSMQNAYGHWASDYYIYKNRWFSWFNNDLFVNCRSDGYVEAGMNGDIYWEYTFENVDDAIRALHPSMGFDLTRVMNIYFERSLSNEDSI